MTERFVPTRIERPEVDAGIADIQDFVSQFTSSTAGFTAYFAGLSIGEAEALGANTIRAN